MQGLGGGAKGESPGLSNSTPGLQRRTGENKAVKEGETSSSVIYLMLCFSLPNVFYALNIGFKHVPSASLSFLVHMETAGAIIPSDATV